MAYATKQEMIDRFGQTELAQLSDESATAIDDAVLDTALDDAGALIDSYVIRQHSLPLTSTPQVLVRLNCELARYQLYRGRAPEDIKAVHEANIRWLEQLAIGRVSLGLDEADAAVEENDDAPALDVLDRAAGRSNLSGF